MSKNSLITLSDLLEIIQHTTLSMLKRSAYRHEVLGKNIKLRIDNGFIYLNAPEYLRLKIIRTITKTFESLMIRAYFNHDILMLYNFNDGKTIAYENDLFPSKSNRVLIEYNLN